MNAFREKPLREFAFNPAAYDGASFPKDCYTWIGHPDWVRVWQWVCPDLTDSEAAWCVEYARVRLMRVALATVNESVKALSSCGHHHAEENAQ